MMSGKNNYFFGKVTVHIWPNNDLLSIPQVMVDPLKSLKTWLARRRRADRKLLTISAGRTVP